MTTDAVLSPSEAVAKPEPRLGLHVINGGWGESIVLELPDGKWGVVDCYAPNLSDPLSNLTLQFLQQRQVAELEFVALTHPHTDHFRGMSHLFEHCSVRRFWRYGATGPRDLLALQAGYFAQDAEQRRDPDRRTDAEEFLRLLEITTRLRKTRQLKFKHLVGRQELYTASVGTQSASISLTIHGIAPSADDVERYGEQLKDCFGPDRRLKTSFPALRQNLVSAALVVEYGRTRLILGGDVESAGWGEILEECGADRLASQAVKVSHHGSQNGYCDGLWLAFCGDGEPIAIITPYQQQGLPEWSAYQHIRAYTTQVVTTCLPAVSFPPAPRHDLWETYDAGIQLSLTLLFPTFRADRGYRGGVCSFYFDPHQQRIPHAEEFAGSAGPL